jgi:hypothetical protein
MFRTLLSMVLAGLMAFGTYAAPALAAQNNSDAQSIEKVRLKVAKMGLGDKAKVTVRMKDGRKIKGFVTQAGASDFTVRDRKTGDPSLILYSDVLKVEDNRGHSALSNLALGIGIGAAALLTVLVIVFTTLED